MSVRTEASLSLTLESPFLSKGAGAAALGVDACLATDDQGRAIIPGDQIKGLLAAALDDMAKAGVGDAGAIRKRLFGRESADGHAPNRGQALFTDLASAAPIRSASGTPWHHHPAHETDEKRRPLGVLTRIALDDKTGAVRAGHLQVIEMPWPIGTPVDLTGTVVLFAGDETEAARDLAVLRAALALIPAAGAQRSLGFGVVLDHDLRATHGPEPLPAVPDPKQDKGDRVRLVLAADRPVLVDAEQVADNVFQGATVIPGAVLKGALATRLDRGGCMTEGWSKALERLVFNHAHPRVPSLDEAGTPTRTLVPARPLPFSVITDRDPGTGTLTIADALRCLDSGVFASGRAPVFGIDWKDDVRRRVTADVLFQAPLDPLYDMRTHTQMDNTTYTSAEDRLFTWSALVPRLADGSDLTWQVDLVAPEAVDRPFLAVIADRLRAEGLEGVGKTEATLRVVDEPAWTSTPAPAPLPSASPDLWAVTLLTPAVLTPLEVLRTNGDDIQAAYGAYWTDVSGGALEMLNVFAAQRLAGGYQALRYRLDRSDYDPYLLTVPGSVFLLKGDGAATLGPALSTNLALPPSIGARATWRTFPFLPENGFGAIAVSAIDHVAWAATLKGARHAW